uniref:Heterogeneous nuclear ribonucleoprotein Q n=1 Tax=Acrobeloides nanus TaxID=290746 RepID=A0A914C1Q0_9BILA
MSTESEPIIDGKPLSELKVVDLRNELEKLGLPKAGNKKELYDRLKEHLLKEQTSGTTESTQQEVVNPMVAQYLATQQAALAATQRSETSEETKQEEPIEANTTEPSQQTEEITSEIFDQSNETESAIDQTAKMTDVEMQESVKTNGDAEKSETNVEKMDDSGPNPYENDETYKMLVSKKLNARVSQALVDLMKACNVTTEDFDERAVEMLAGFSQDQGLYIVKELKDSGLYGVQNKPQYFMSVMRNFKDRVRQLGSAPSMNIPLVPGPEVEDIKSIIDRTGYQLEVTVGQRKYHCPPDHTGGEPAGSGHEIYIGQIPRDVYEDKLIPLFEPLGKIWDLRIMMDPINGKSRGYAFLIYIDKEHAAEAAKKFNDYEIQPGKHLKVNVSVANTRLFIGNIPKSKSKEEILEELKKNAEGVVDVIIYSSPDGGESRKNRGFCFVDFVDHKSASDAKRRISMGKVRPWNNDLVVDWAEQQEEPDEETMNQVKVLYVKNLKEAVTEEKLKEIFAPHGEIDRVKKVKDYAFVHYKERDSAIKAIDALNNTEVEGIAIEIALAKPQAENKQKKKFGGPSSMRGMFGAGGGGGKRGLRGSFGEPFGVPPRGGRGRHRNAVILKKANRGQQQSHYSLRKLFIA